MAPSLLQAGEIVNAHGVHGEVKILPWADGPEFLLQFDTLYLQDRPYKVEFSRVHKSCVLCKLEGVDDAAAATHLRGQVVSIDRDGLELIRFVRQKFLTPIVVLSARTTEQDKIEALDLGANDYITKPFGTGELLARVRAALRTNRFGVLGGMPGGVFRAQGLEINYERRKVFVDGAEVKLTQTEYNIVAFLSEHAGRVMTYAAIVRAIWGDTDCGSTKKLQVNMANIRKKLGSVPGRNTYILNELGVGYRMIDEDTDARPES